MQQHLDFGHGTATDMRVHKPHLVESLARAALKKVPNAGVNKHFLKGDWKPSRPLKPPPIRPQKMYTGSGTV